MIDMDLVEGAREYMNDLEADRKMFARVSEIDEVMNKVKRCSRLCGKGKDGLSYLWYGETIRAMKEALELLGYMVTKQTEPKRGEWTRLTDGVGLHKECGFIGHTDDNYCGGCGTYMRAEPKGEE